MFHKRFPQLYMLILGEKFKIITGKTVRSPKYICFLGFPKGIWSGVMMPIDSEG